MGRGRNSRPSNRRLDGTPCYFVIRRQTLEPTHNKHEPRSNKLPGSGVGDDWPERAVLPDASLDTMLDAMSFARLDALRVVPPLSDPNSAPDTTSSVKSAALYSSTKCSSPLIGKPRTIENVPDSPAKCMISKVSPRSGTKP